MRRTYVLGVTALLALTGCGSDEAAVTGVPWGDYASGVQARIDAMATDADCAGLQAEFDQADANGDATMDRTGHNNAELMKYIDGKMRAAGCY